MTGIAAWLRGVISARHRVVSSPPSQVRHAQAALSRTVADANNAFAAAIYRQLCHHPGNIFLSPLSIHAILTLAQTGASGDTATQMRDMLGLRSLDDPLSAVVDPLEALKSEVSANGELAVANGIWVHDGMTLRSEFEAAAASCGARATLVDFHRRSDAARALINEWVDAITKHKIRELVPPGLLDANTRLVMANAIYFKGRWVSQFPKAHTREGQFFLEQGGTTSVPFMHQEVAIPHARTAMYEAVQLPYKGNGVSMVIVLPNPGRPLHDVEAVFSATMLRECLSAMRVYPLDVFLPRFTLRWAADLSLDLAVLGMRLAFTADADFSGINGAVPRDDDALYIRAVLHKAFVDVNEEGTEAGAATAVVMTALGLPPTFRADRPFLFVIIEQQSGAVLFVGRVATARVVSGITAAPGHSALWFVGARGRPASVKTMTVSPVGTVVRRLARIFILDRIAPL